MRIWAMAKLMHEVWVRSDENGQDLHACILGGSLGSQARAMLIAEGARLVWTFEAGSHLEAMKIYHRRAHGDDYGVDDRDWISEPYPNEWFEQQQADRR